MGSVQKELWVSRQFHSGLLKVMYFYLLGKFIIFLLLNWHTAVYLFGQSIYFTVLPPPPLPHHIKSCLSHVLFQNFWYSSGREHLCYIKWHAPCNFIEQSFQPSILSVFLLLKCLFLQDLQEYGGKKGHWLEKDAVPQYSKILTTAQWAEEDQL